MEALLQNIAEIGYRTKPQLSDGAFKSKDLLQRQQDKPMAEATTKLKKQVLALADQGVKISEICRRLPVSRWTVWRLLKERKNTEVTGEFNKSDTETTTAIAS